MKAQLLALALGLLAALPAAAQDLAARPLVRGFRVEGNTVLPQSEIETALAPFTGRRLAAEDLIAARDALTRLYLDHGYATSGAYLPDQRVSDGIVVLRVEEGELEDVRIRGAKHLRAGVLRERLLREVDGPLDLGRLRDTLERLQDGPLLEGVRATLVPGTRPGRSQLELSVQERRQTVASLVLDNAQSPSIGAERGELRVQHYNLLGLGDELDLSTELTRGQRSYDALYSLPLGPRETLLDLYWRTSHADVVEEPFDALDIYSRWRVFGAGLRHPLQLGSSSVLWLGLQGELLRSRTYLEDQRFGFAAGSDHGETRITALRATQEWIARSMDDVIAARSTLSFGIDAFDASDVGGGAPDGTFFAWLGQVQWAHRLGSRFGGAQLVARADLQLTPDPLLSPERFALGGAYSVRGYRENQLIRDNAVVASAELRFPLLRSLDGNDRLQLATFLDFGHGWDHGSTRGPKTLAATGLGLRWRLGNHGLATAYWGIPLRHVSTTGDDWLQNHGLHLSVTLFSPQ